MKRSMIFQGERSVDAMNNTTTKKFTKFYAIVCSAYFIFTVAIILIFGLTFDHNLLDYHVRSTIETFLSCLLVFSPFIVMVIGQFIANFIGKRKFEAWSKLNVIITFIVSFVGCAAAIIAVSVVA